MPDLLALVFGLVLLTFGADLLVRSASKLATFVGISPLVVGLTVVAFGTSAPELAVGIRASLAGQADVALGNVVGSNIFNVLLILGLSALVTPLVVQQKVVRQEVPLMIALSLLVYFLAFDGGIGRIEGTALFLCLVLYSLFLIRQSRKESSAVRMEYEEAVHISPPLRRWGVAVDLLLIVAGLALLVWGADWLVSGASAIARQFGVSDLIIGLTIVAGGTSLPELATSVVAGIRGERDIAVGNVVGSNIFNLLCVLGLSAAVGPEGISVSSAALHFDLPVMILAAAACLPVFLSGHLISRWEGLFFLLYYGVYLAYLLLLSSQHDALDVFSSTLFWFAIPLTLVVLAVSLWRSYRERSLE